MAVIYNGGMRRHLTESDLKDMFTQLGERDIISDAAAQTIAAWWYSGNRSATVALATGGVVRSDLELDDFADPEEYDNCDEWGKKCLRALQTYIQRKRSDYLTNNPFLCPMCCELAVRDLNTLDYSKDTQCVECEHCYEDLKREWNGFRWSGWGLDV